MSRFCRTTTKEIMLTFVARNIYQIVKKYICPCLNNYTIQNFMSYQIFKDLYSYIHIHIHGFPSRLAKAINYYQHYSVLTLGE